VRVKVRAVIVDRVRLLVVPERRRGAHSHMALPGGRVGGTETVGEALVREVREETGLDVVPQRLLYVAEVTAPHKMHEVNLIFLAEPAGTPNLGELIFVDLADDDHPMVLPPIVAEIARDVEQGWVETPRWLGNVWDESLNDRRKQSAS
jgi:ADP-ribose pyrophosphatase YjhB (NUDIX family)